MKLPELVPVRPADRVILGPAPCQACSGPVAFTLPDPPLSFLGSWRHVGRSGPSGGPYGERLAVGTMAHRCPAPAVTP